MKETISQRQAVSILILFILGSSLIMGASSLVAQDSWIAQLTAAAMAIPVLMLYARLIRLFPGKNLFDMALSLFGRFGGKLLILAFSWYALHLGAIVTSNFTGFFLVVSLEETPEVPVQIILLSVVAYMVISGIETLGKWSLIGVTIVIFVVMLTTILCIKKMHFSNILPIFAHGPREIAAAAYRSLTFPYAETVLLLCTADSFKSNESPYKLYFLGIVIGTAVFVVAILRNVGSLGPAMIAAEYFPSYVAVKLIEAGEFFQRIEASISMNFYVAGIVKISVCVLAASKGLAKLFGILSYRKIVLPVVLLVMAISAIAYESIMEMFGFIDYYKYYAIPFQFLMPVIFWLTAEFRKKRKAKPSGT